jgi:hypothetical protein
VIVEAYRHLVDPFADAGMTGEMVAPRRFLTLQVEASDLLDLRTEDGYEQVGLSLSDLQSPVGEYGACQRVGQVAHQLGLHGIISRAATELGETLALFERHLPAFEMPIIVAEEVLDGLPTDPRRLRLIDRPSETG